MSQIIETIWFSLKRGYQMHHYCHSFLLIHVTVNVCDACLLFVILTHNVATVSNGEGLLAVLKDFFLLSLASLIGLGKSPAIEKCIHIEVEQK